mgnify:FL=1
MLKWQLLGIGLGIFLTILACVFVIGVDKNNTKEYNNGTHAECGGKWQFMGVDKGYFWYECDECGETTYIIATTK